MYRGDKCPVFRLLSHSYNLITFRDTAVSDIDIHTDNVIRTKQPLCIGV